MKLRVLFLTRYEDLGASSRVRALQFLPVLEKSGLACTVAPLLTNQYLRDKYAGQQALGFSLAKAYAARIATLLQATRFDVIWVEKELMPWMPGWVEAGLLKGRRFVLDFDDAIFHNYDLHPNPLVRALYGGKIDRLMRHATLVVAGNRYLADRAERAGAPWVEQLPSVIDLSRYQTERVATETFTIGWIGSPGSERVLAAVRDVLAEVVKDPLVRLVLVGGSGQHLEGIRHETRPWHEETEVEEIQKFDVGIMPLPDEPWTRGKCGYKLIQYMGCARPVVASPVGVNTEIVREGINGFLADDQSAWMEALMALKTNPKRAARMGEQGREIVAERYSLQVAGPRMAELLAAAAQA